MVRYSLQLLMTTRTRCCYLPGKRVGDFGVGPFGTVRYSLHFLMTTRSMCCYLHGKRRGGIHGDPFGTVLCVLFERRHARSAAIRTVNAPRRDGRRQGQFFDILSWGGVNIYIREWIEAYRPRGGLFGTILSALFDDDAHDVLLFARETCGRLRGPPVWYGTLCTF